MQGAGGWPEGGPRGGLLGGRELARRLPSPAGLVPSLFLIPAATLGRAYAPAERGEEVAGGGDGSSAIAALPLPTRTRALRPPVAHTQALSSGDTASILLALGAVAQLASADLAPAVVPLLLKRSMLEHEL